MRLACALLLPIVALVAASSVLHADQYPYRAYVSGSGVYVRSGPGKDYYPTDKLQHGAIVEVYRHDPGGWYAVRPPRGSFSWVAGRHLKVQEENLAEVTGDRVVAYVGSKFSDVHDVRQIHLDRGEFVEIIGEKRSRPKEGIAETWYKVLPPSGEFRWVSGRYLIQKGDPDTLAGRDGDGLGDAVVHDGDAHGNSYDNSYGDHGDHHHSDQHLGDGNGERVQIASASYDGSDEASEQTGGHRDTVTHHEPSSIRGDGHGNEASGGSNAGRVYGPDDQRLDLQLSMIISEPPENWDLADVRSRTEDAVREAQTALDRGRARSLLREIARFEAMKQQYLADENPHTSTAAVAGPVNTTPDGPYLSAPQVGQSNVAPNTDSHLARFAGIGRLTPVVSRKIGAPKFALTNTKGDVLMFVTPSIGVDLQPFVGKVVGLSGARGFMPALRKTHLAASQVEQLEPNALVATRPRPSFR